MAIGFDQTDRSGASVHYRVLAETDDLEAVTRMLHAAYKPLADAGMRYTASYQDVEVTRRRASRGDTIVAVSQERIVGIITLRRPGVLPGPAHYARADVVSFGQFAVDPAFQGRGIGARLLEIVEELAREMGAAEIALDTSERASSLLELYGSRGYRVVDVVQWEDTNYRSLVLSKPLVVPQEARGRAQP